jgi:hypothetical protein
MKRARSCERAGLREKQAMVWQERSANGGAFCSGHWVVSCYRVVETCHWVNGAPLPQDIFHADELVIASTCCTPLMICEVTPMTAPPKLEPFTHMVSGEPFTTFEGRKRVMQMRDWTRQQLAGEPQALGAMFLFADLMQPLEPRGLLFERRWYTLLHDEPIALLGGQSDG